MKSAFVRNPLSAITLAALTSPALVHADCIPTAPVGYSVPFKLTSLQNFRGTNSPTATYVDGALAFTSHNDLFRGTTLSGKDNQQLFSDRTYGRECGSGKIRLCSLEQPFDIEQAGTLSVSISDGENLAVPVFPSKGVEILVTFNNKKFYAGTCDSASEALYFSDDDTMYVMTFGTPAAPPRSPP
jgi:hypothetical protein